MKLINEAPKWCFLVYDFFSLTSLVQDFFCNCTTPLPSKIKRSVSIVKKTKKEKRKVDWTGEKLKGLIRPLDYVFASPVENVKSRLVLACLIEYFRTRCPETVSDPK